jgi:Domain of unknown function (DUF4157)
MSRTFKNASPVQPTRVARQSHTVVSHWAPARWTGADSAGPVDEPGSVQRIARAGFAGPGTSLPHRERIQHAFGRHDLSGVEAHVGGPAAAAAGQLGAEAFTTGNQVAFRAPPDLYTAAHEAAHVVQQARGVHPRAATGYGGDPYERHADAVAAQVVRGQSAEKLLSAPPHAAGPARADRAPAPASDTAPVQMRKCDGSKDDPASIITSHTVSPNKIEKPGDSVTIDVGFACQVRSWNSHLETQGGGSLKLGQPTTRLADRFTRTWDGKRLYDGIGTYLVADGTYRHRLEKILYGYRYNKESKKSDNVHATGDLLVSPPIEVKARARTGSGAKHPHATAENIAALAAIIESEIGIGNADEQKAVAWAVRNQMVRMNTASVARAQDHFRDAHGKGPSAGAKAIAEEILGLPMSSDTTGGAIKWFSPRSMPKKGESCQGVDCRGGLISVRNESDKIQKVYAPAWHKSMTYVSVSGVREWYMRFYRL